MNIRDGFVTNSSSTNFLIISKEELTVDYLFDKLGFLEGSPLERQGRQLCEDIIYAIHPSSSDKEIDYTEILNEFGPKAAELHAKKHEEGFRTYTGRTSSENAELTTTFTTDFVEIEEDDFYLNGLNYIW